MTKKEEAEKKRQKKKAEKKAKLEDKLFAMSVMERELLYQGKTMIAGVDEVGRGPLAGPVVAGCVVLPASFDVLGVDDSKKLSEKKRKELAVKIKEKALAYGLGMASEKVIDKINILEATKGAMRIAIDEANKMLNAKFGEDISFVLFDAMTIKNLPFEQRSVVKGDARSVSIAAASIIAKVTRDEMMINYAKKYPGYSFESNKGYGTKAHYAGLRELGPCEIHRRTFLKNLK